MSYLQKGIMEYSDDYESIGDCGSTGNAEEKVHQTRDEFVEQLCSDPKYAHVKGVLIEVSNFHNIYYIITYTFI